MKHALTVLAAWLGNLEALTGSDVEDFARALPLPPEFEAERGKLAALAAGKGAGAEAEALRLARQLAAGQSENHPQGSHLPGIFSQVRLAGKGGPPCFYSFQPVDEPQAIFPLPRPRGDMAALAAAFRKDIANLPLDMGAHVYLGALASCLERYAWCVPLPQSPDVSIYDASSVTCAIAQALLEQPGDGQPLLLFGGELSGIQAFIFGREGQADKNASKLLRARSFLLQALSRAIWLILIERLGLSPAARIMDAGGRFVLLLPDTPQTRTVCDALEAEVQKWLLDAFNGTVRMTFAMRGILPDDLRRHKFAASFDTFNDALEKAKLQPLRKSFQAGLSPVFKVDHGAYAKFGECPHCHGRPAQSVNGACPLCQSLIRDIGAKLPRAAYLVFSRHGDGLELLDGVKIRLAEKEPKAAETQAALDVIAMRSYGKCATAPVAGHMPLIGPEDLRRWRDAGKLADIDGKPCFDGDECHVGQPKTFAMLADLARVAMPDNAWRCIPCLAVCKADVDNLGLIFGLGFSAGRSFSIARYAMLARMLNFFFSWHLMDVIARDFPNIYVIFAGGDDLFVLGPWPDIIRFGQRLRDDFTAFAGNNPDITLSAGLPLLKPDLPMRALRDMAEEMLEKSKDSSPDKNAASLFGITTPWRLYADLFTKGQWLEGLCLDGKLSQGFVRRMLGYSKACAEFTKGGKLSSGLYLSHLAYDLGRNCKPEENGGDISAADVDELKKMGQDKDTFPLAQFPLSWALYRTRAS